MRVPFNIMGLTLFSLAVYCSQLFHFGLVYVVFSFNYVLVVCFSFAYHVGVLLETAFVLRRECSFLVHGYGALTCFDIGVILWSLCAPWEILHVIAAVAVV